MEVQCKRFLSNLKQNITRIILALIQQLYLFANIRQYTLIFNVYFFITAHISKCAGSVIFLNNVRRSEKAVLRLRLVADVFSKIVLRNRVNFTILISNYKKTAGVNRGNFSDLNSAYFNL